MGFFEILRSGLEKTRKGMTEKIEQALKAFTKIDEDLFEEIEEILITSDAGIEVTEKIIKDLRDKVKEKRITEAAQVKDLLKEEIIDILTGDAHDVKVPQVMLVIGVNGVGKTTSIGKIAHVLKQSGKKVIVGAADTFRAAAIDQLEVWAKRSGVDIIKHTEGSDPAAVVFDTLQAAKSRKADVIICDTAGRLHNKKNLMEELKKINKIIDREMPGSHRETLLVIDATTGQNGLSQAKLFNEAVPIDGIILTKLDGTAKGGIVLSIKSEMDIPIKFVGVGEGIDDLQKFDAEEFVHALLD